MFNRIHAFVFFTSSTLAALLEKSVCGLHYEGSFSPETWFLGFRLR